MADGKFLYEGNRDPYVNLDTFFGPFRPIIRDLINYLWSQ